MKTEKMPDVQIELLTYLSSLDGVELRNHSMRKIATSSGIKRSVYTILSAFSALIKKGLIETMLDGNLKIIKLTKAGRDAIGLKICDEEVDEIHPEFIESLEDFSENEETAEYAEQLDGEPVESVYDVDDSQKNKQIVDTINDTMAKTLAFCQQLANSIEATEVNPKLQEELQEALDTVRKQQMLIDAYETDVEDHKQAVYKGLGMLKIKLNNECDIFFGMTQWQQNSNQKAFVKQLAALVSEMQQDVKSMFGEEPEEDIR